jgi:hypothetical protein
MPLNVQGRQQTRRTNEHANWEREGRNNVENLFGVVVDDNMLNNMARFRGKPKMREDLAREANILVNEGGKRAYAYLYLHHPVPLFANSGTLCLVYNATGDTLYQVANHDWHGYICGAPYPTEIGNGQWAAFRHAGSLTKGSVAAVVYRGQNKYGTDHDYLLAWCVPSFPYLRNKVSVT